MKTIKTAALFFIIAFLFHSCAPPLTEKDNGRTIELSDESSFTINLTASQGMVWKVVSYDEDLIKPPQIEVTETTDNSGKPIKEFSFTFDTYGSGESVVSIDYVDENGMDEFPEKTFDVKIICGTMGRIESD